MAVLALDESAISSAKLRLWGLVLGSSAPSHEERAVFSRVELLYVGPDLDDRRWSFAVKSEVRSRYALPEVVRIQGAAVVMENCLLSVPQAAGTYAYGGDYRHFLNAETLVRAPVETVHVVQPDGHPAMWSIRRLLAPLPLLSGVTASGDVYVEVAACGTTAEHITRLLSSLSPLVIGDPRVRALDETLAVARAYSRARFRP